MKDIILYFFLKYGVVVGIGYVMEFYGEVIYVMDMEERMMFCNMVIEGGVKVGIIVLDEKMFVYVKGCKYVLKDYEFIKKKWLEFYIDLDVVYDLYILVDVMDLVLYVMWGINFSMGVWIDEKLLEKYDVNDERVFFYMGLSFG